MSCVTTNTKSLNNKPKTRKHIIHGKQNILVKCKLGSGREIGANDNTDKKMNMAYPDQFYVASADSMEPVGANASADPT